MLTCNKARLIQLAAAATEYLVPYFLYLIFLKC